MSYIGVATWLVTEKKEVLLQQKAGTSGNSKIWQPVKERVHSGWAQDVAFLKLREELEGALGQEKFFISYPKEIAKEEFTFMVGKGRKITGVRYHFVVSITPEELLQNTLPGFKLLKKEDWRRVRKSIFRRNPGVEDITLYGADYNILVQKIWQIQTVFPDGESNLALFISQNKKGQKAYFSKNSWANLISSVPHW